MPIRKISILRTGYHVRREPEDERKYLDISNIKDGLSYREILKNAWDIAEYAELGLKAQDRAIDLLPTEEVGDVLLLKGMVGHTGEPGQIKDTTTDNIVHLDDDGTLTKQGLLRVAYIECVDYLNHGFFVIEQTSNGNLNAVVQKVMRKAMKTINSKLTVDFPPVQNQQNWLANIAQLKEIHIVRERHAVDADNLEDVGSDSLRAQVLIRPPKGNRGFPAKTLERLRKKKLDPHTLISFPEASEEEAEKIRVKLGDGQRSKLMDLDDLRGLNYQAVIADYGEAVPDDESFVRVCREHLYDLLGVGATS